MTTQSRTHKEYDLHPRFYQILNIPPCPLSRAEMAYHFRHYLERTGAYIISETGQDEYIVMTADVSLLSGINEGESFIIKESGEDRNTFSDFARIVWRRVVQ
jgi:hypothetical protein